MGSGCLVYPRVQGGVIDLPDLFSRFCMVVQLDGIGLFTAKSVSRVEKVDKLQGGHIIADVLLGLFQLFPLAFPHLHHMVPFSSQQLRSLLGEAVHIIYRSVQKAKVGLPTDRLAGWTPVPETPMELVDVVGLGIEPVLGDAGVWQLALTPVSYDLDAVAHSWMVMVNLGIATGNRTNSTIPVPLWIG